MAHEQSSNLAEWGNEFNPRLNVFTLTGHNYSTISQVQIRFGQMLHIIIDSLRTCIIHGVTFHLSTLQVFKNLITVCVCTHVCNHPAAFCWKQAGSADECDLFCERTGCDASTWLRQTTQRTGSGLKRQNPANKRKKECEQSQSMLKARGIKPKWRLGLIDQVH